MTGFLRLIWPLVYVQLIALCANRPRRALALTPELPAPVPAPLRNKNAYSVYVLSDIALADTS
jgi:hypothetical protein